MSGQFPFFSEVTCLQASDFHFFSNDFKRAIRTAIPTAVDIFFLHGSTLPQALPDQFRTLLGISQALSDCVKDDVPQVIQDVFLLPFGIADGLSMVALISGIDPLVADRAAQDWLLDVRDSLQRQFLAIRKGATDPQTMLFNNSRLHGDLTALEPGDRLDLILVEVYPRVRTAMAAMQAVRQSVSLVKSITGETLPLYYLGQGLLAILCLNVDERISRRLAPAILSLLKREKLPRAHVGCSQGIMTDDDGGDLRQNGLQVLDQAWSALQVACRRGPFGLCLHDSLDQPEYLALTQSTRRVVARFQRYWRELDHFALIQLKGAINSDKVEQILNAEWGPLKVYRENDGDVFILLPDGNPEKAMAAARTLQGQLHAQSASSSGLAVGIAVYPLSNTSKSEVVLNCRRALQHGALLGHGQIVVCDALSYNVSGDVFFNEGDLPRAVRDYRQGLLLAPGEVNLLNSLGVAHVLMNHQRLGIACFEQVLAAEPLNFMALYNLGLEQEQQGDYQAAIATFEKALAVIQDPSLDADVAEPSDFGLQLGKLYCRIKHYQQALDCLIPWYELQGEAARGGQALRLLGEASLGAGRAGEAERWLQRALRFDEFDAAAMSLLGLIYLDRGQGDRIALSLCVKSVELQPDVPLFHLRLARAQRRCQGFAEARKSLRICLRRKDVKGPAQLEMAKICRAQGQERRAQSWLVKMLTTVTDESPLVGEARRLLSKQ